MRAERRNTVARSFMRSESAAANKWVYGVKAEEEEEEEGRHLPLLMNSTEYAT